jgi:DNA-binding IclR family transcriptional regulator
MTITDSNKSSTALRALQIMEMLGNANRPLSVAEVAEGIDADRSTAYRMLVTLLDAGYVRRDTSERHYLLGYKLLSLTKGLLNDGERTELIGAALQRISAETQETAHYSVFDRDACVLVQRSKGTQLVAVDFQIGDRSPLHCSSAGKVLLAYLDLRVVEEIMARGLPRFAMNSMTRPEELHDELRKIRAEGYAIDDREFHDDMRCVSVPVFDKSGMTAAISLSGPSSRFTIEKLHQLLRPITGAANDLSRKFGGLA